MRLVELRLRNFRCFQQETRITFEDLTVLIGRNDAGKSSILDALDIFFNESPPDKHDASKGGNAKDLGIIAIFDDLPAEIVLDETQATSLAEEHLLNDGGLLEVHKVFNGSLEKPKLSSLHLVANHPTFQPVSDLVRLTNDELKTRARGVNADLAQVDERSNSQLRRLIRQTVGALELRTIPVPLMEKNAEKFWQGIKASLPAFALFKSDRNSTDQDDEAQDPLDVAIKEALKEKEEELRTITAHVEQRVKLTADLTLKKLKEMDASLANSLVPRFLAPKWPSLFKASISGDDDIPINKRGSGVRRLILLNFFRAKAEQSRTNQHRESVIYAIEEPETSQHPRNQRMLMNALRALVGPDQVIITTHTPVLARTTPSEGIRYVENLHGNPRNVFNGGTQDVDRKIIDSLGVLPDHNVKLFLGVEGKNDISFLKHMARLLSSNGHQVPDLESLEIEGELIFVPLGGENLALWVDRLKGLNRPEFHIYDRDTIPPAVPKYQQSIDELNARTNCEGRSTNKREAENYIHHQAINLALAELDINHEFATAFGDFDDVPSLVASELNRVVGPGNRWGNRRAKEFLCNHAASKMTIQMLEAVDPQGEIQSWLRRIGELMNQALQN